MKKNHIIFAGIVLFLSLISGAAQELEDGFVTFSEGDGGSRTLKYRKVTNGELGEAKTIVEKGSADGDIESIISFDGKWIAFARKREARCPKQGGQWNGNGEDDYHKFHCVGIFIARLDDPDAFPVEPIEVIEEGYWPSWGDDSFGPEKTLYFGVWTKGGIWKTTVSDADNTFTDPVKHDDVPNWGAGDHHMQCSPNGKYIAIRHGNNMSIVGIDGTNHNKGIGGGCHPSWCADSKHLYHASGWVGNIDGGRVGGAANYHFGSSSNMKWAITLSSGVVNNAQNNGYPVKWGAMEYDEEDSVITRIGSYNSPTVTSKGNFPDIHDFKGMPVRVDSKPPAPANLRIELKGGQLIVNMAFPGIYTIELYAVNGARRANPIKSHSSRTVISVKDYTKGIYILRVNSEGKSVLKKLKIM